MKTAFASAALLLAATVCAAQNPARQPGRDMGGGDCAHNPYNCADTPNPLPAQHGVAGRDDVDGRARRDEGRQDHRHHLDRRDRAERSVAGDSASTTTCCRPTAKRSRARWATRCARRSIKFVPEGDIDRRARPHGRARHDHACARRRSARCSPTSSHSFKAHGFKKIIFIGDSGGNQAGQRAVAEKLNAKWAGDPLVAHIPEYYDYAGVAKYMETHGIKWTAKRDNMHDDPDHHAQHVHHDPKSVRYDERVKAGKATINGVSIADKAKNTELGEADRRVPRRRRPSRRSTRRSPTRARCRRRRARSVRHHNESRYAVTTDGERTGLDDHRAPFIVCVAPCATGATLFFVSSHEPKHRATSDGVSDRSARQLDMAVCIYSMPCRPTHFG